MTSIKEQMQLAASDATAAVTMDNGGDLKGALIAYKSAVNLLEEIHSIANDVKEGASEKKLTKIERSVRKATKMIEAYVKKPFSNIP